MYRFLFIDDEDMARDFFGGILSFEEYGFTLERTFSTAEAALAYLRQTPGISAVITDILMGGVSGIDLCERIREYDDKMLLVCLTGFKEFEYAQRAIKCRVFDYLLKPILYDDIENLFRRMKKHLDANQSAAGDDPGGGADYHYLSIVQMAKEYIEGHYSDDITLESVAAHVSMNPAYFSRFFKQHTGSNFIDYLTRCRIERAKKLLHDPTLRVAEVCGRVGYRAPQHFIKLFRQYTNCTPSEYRNKLGISSINS